MNNTMLAVELARKLFEIGSDPHRPVHRIEFKAISLGGKEVGMGGFVEPALAGFFERTLDALQDNEKGESDE